MVVLCYFTLKNNMIGGSVLDKIAVLIPCYNEAVTIRKVIEDYRAELPEATIYVYDNNSKDNTSEIAREAGAIVRHEYIQGKGNVIRSMFRDIEAECYLMVDGDGSHPSAHAREMVSYVLSGEADMVIGDRLSSTYFTENKRHFHNTGNKLVRRLINTLFKSKENDIMTGYRALSYLFVKSYPVMSRGFELETEMTIHGLDKKFKMKNVTVNFVERQEGTESTLNTFTDGFRVIKTTINLFKNYRPLAFFGIISIVLMLVALALFIPILIEFFRTDLVMRMPTFVLSVFIGLTSVLSLSVGLILDVTIQQSKQDYELLLNQTHTMMEMKNMMNEFKSKQ